MQTPDSDIFTLSCCLEHENHTRQKILAVLADLGFDMVCPESTNNANCRLRRGAQQVYLCLVDSTTMILDRAFDGLSPNDILITDNDFAIQPRGQLYRLPDSWLGIYAHQPVIRCECPDRPFTLAINRSSPARLWVFLSMLGQDLPGYMNYNGQSNDRGQSSGHQQIARDWDRIVLARSQVESTYRQLQDHWPYSNHSLDHDQALQSGLLNMVMETYYQAITITHSEKIFRALVSSRPWTVYGNRHLVRRLSDLGFDVLADLVAHDHYDALAHSQLKLQAYLDVSLQAAQSLEWSQIRDRCWTAATHNRALLARWRATWEDDLDQWLSLLRQCLA